MVSSTLPKLPLRPTRAISREELWSGLFAYLHEEVIADVMLFHMVGFSRVNPRIDFAPTIRTNSELQLSQIGLD